MAEMKQTGTANKQGCSTMLIFAISIVWIIGVSVFAQLMTWLMEQTIFEAAILFPDLRWLIIAAYASLISLPLFMMVFLFSDRLLKQIFRFWALLGALGFLMIPARFVDISDSVLIAIGQLGAIIVFGLLLLFLTKNNQEQVKITWRIEPRVIGIVLIFLAILIIPWVLWGALGSALDIVLHSLVAFSGSVLLIYLFLYQFYRSAETKEQFEAGNIFRGLVLFTGLIIFSTVLGQSGQQLLLFFILPLSSWIIIRFLETSSIKPIAAILFLSGLISFPLIWIDADELSLITSSGTGELIYWVNRSVITTVVLLLILTALTGLFSHSILKIKKNVFLITVPLIWMIVVMIYFTIGQPGFYGESMFVILKDQADISFVSSIETYPERRSTTYRTLTEHANQTQKDIREQLDRYHIPYTPYYLVNAIEVKAGPIVRFYLSSRPEVDRILDNPYLRPLPEEIPISEGDFPKPSELAWNIKMIEADSVWSTYGITGEGIVIGQSDSGVDGRHPAFKDKYAGLNGKINAWFDPWYHSTVPQDFGGHGTHTLGTILGDHIGIAPGAEWIGCVNLARNLGNPVYYLDCMQFMLAPYPDQGNSFEDGDPTTGAHVLNNSWGCPEIEGCDVDVYLDAVKALRAAGVFVVSSVGNSGYYGCESVTDPIAIYDDVTSVGAINEDGFLSSFSSLGPVVVDESGRIKPDLVAPGEEILSAMPNGTYAKLSGTSMAGPHVVGVVALMWSANPALIGQVELTEQILFETTSPFEGILPACIGINKHPNNAVGYGVVNAQRAVEEAIKIR